MDFLLGMHPLIIGGIVIILVAGLLFGVLYLIFAWFKILEWVKAKSGYTKRQEEKRLRGKTDPRDAPIEDRIIREIVRFILIVILCGVLFVLLPVLLVVVFFSPIWGTWLAEEIGPAAFIGLLILIFGVAYWIKRAGDLRSRRADNDRAP